MRLLLATTAFCAASLWATAQDGPVVPHQDTPFLQQTSVSFVEGLPAVDVERIRIDEAGRVVVFTTHGAALLEGGQFQAIDGQDKIAREFAVEQVVRSDAPVASAAMRDVAHHEGASAVAAAEGLYTHDGTAWSMALPQDGPVRWAPVDVRVVAYDSEGRLWFGCPQGVGYRIAEGEWKLFTGAEGLPYNDFTSIAAGSDGEMWFGTTNGAIRYHAGTWEFRQGRRWLIDNHVNDIAVDGNGNAWFATEGGVSCIEFRPMTLAEKAAYYEEEIDKYHRRTKFGYVEPAILEVPGDRATAKPRPTDNDGQFTGLYLAGQSFAYAATGRAEFKERAKRAFEAVAFLGTVTEGGTPPGKPGYIARCVVPADGPNPNDEYSPERDRKIIEVRDKNWRVMDPRWPLDESGEWYWLSDTSTDELNGHFYAFSVYYDFACETDEEKEAVRKAVSRIADHLIANNHTLIDYDGSETRWGRFSPDELNRSVEWVPERGLNSMSALAYMATAHHVTGDQKYRDEYLRLALDEGYAMNAATHSKYQSGPGSFGQGDDHKAFYHYYLLLRYETDPNLLAMYQHAALTHWQIEKYEDNPFYNFIYAATCSGKEWEGAFRTIDLTPPDWWLERSVETLERFPLDMVNWAMSNAHRTDMLPLPDHTQEGGENENLGYRVDGRVFPVDERPLIRLGGLGDEPWLLSTESTGTLLRDGVRYLLPYYMGLAHGFIEAE